MSRIVKVKLFLVSCLVIALAIVILSTGMVVGQEDPFVGIKEKMASISETERENLQSLFVLGQQIKVMEKEEEEITHNIETKNGEIESLKLIIAGDEIVYAKKLEDLKRVFKSYQRMGPGTYLEILLDSDNLATLLWKINILRDLTRNTGKLIELLDESKAKQLTKKTNLAEKITLMEDNQKQLRESLTKKKQLIEDQEKYLATLKEERKHYQEYLANIQQKWDELKTSFPETIKELSSIIEEGDFPPDKLNITYDFMSINGSIDENTLNDIISGYPLLPKIVFSFYPSKVVMSMPEKNLILSGIFVIHEGHTLKFKLKEGSFFGIPLDSGAIEEFFQKGDLKFDLKLPLSSYTINSIKTTAGYLELTITPKY